MGVVNKRADELKPGDVLIGNGMAGRVVHSIGKPSGNSIEVKTQGADGVVSTFIGAVSSVSVIVPDLTPAQQHADALLAFVEAAAASSERTALLDKIHPPALPTLDEVMTSLAGLSDPAVTAAESKRRIEALVASARRAGWGK